MRGVLEGLDIRVSPTSDRSRGWKQQGSGSPLPYPHKQHGTFRFSGKITVASNVLLTSTPVVINCSGKVPPGTRAVRMLIYSNAESGGWWMMISPYSNLGGRHCDLTLHYDNVWLSDHLETELSHDYKFSIWSRTMTSANIYLHIFQIMT